MSDFEKVKQGLRCCKSCLKSHCEECPYDGAESTFDCTADLTDGALSVIEELQAEIARLKAEKHKPNCSSAEHNPSTGKCCGYGRSENDDEPIDACKSCELYVSYGIE